MVYECGLASTSTRLTVGRTGSVAGGGGCESELGAVVAGVMVVTGTAAGATGAGALTEFENRGISVEYFGVITGAGSTGSGIEMASITPRIVCTSPRARATSDTASASWRRALSCTCGDAIGPRIGWIGDCCILDWTLTVT
jgi:hypothetical protein